MNVTNIRTPDSLNWVGEENLSRLGTMGIVLASTLVMLVLFF